MEIENHSSPSEESLRQSKLGRHTSRGHQRRRLLASVAAVSVVIGLLVLSNRSGEYYALMAPGELSNPHAQLWQGSEHAKSCKSCHPGIDDTTDAAVSSAATIHSEKSQQEACAVCHANELNHLLRGSPHDLPHERLVQLGQAQPNTQTSSRLVSLEKPIIDVHLDWQHRSFQCNDCHREHQGRDAMLSAMDNVSCQACHQKRFDSFENQHSEFSSYPQPSPTPAFAFNHRSHAFKHFPKQQAQFDCSVCHLKQESGLTKLVRTTSFEAACAKCHRDPLSTTLGDGVVLWQLPNINTEEFIAAKSEPLRWPEIASAVTDLELTPLMRQLIVGELQQSNTPQADLAALRVAVAENLSDLAIESDEANETIRLAAVSSQKVLQDIVANGQDALKKRLKRLHTDDAANQYEVRLVDELAKGMPPDLFDEAYRNWFGDVLSGAKASGGQREEIKSPFLPQLEPPRAIPPKDKSASNGGFANNGSTKTPLTAKATDNDLLGNDLLGGDLSEMPKGDLVGATAVQSPQPNEYDSRKHLKAGGWMIDRVRNAVVYIPSGHGDRWMQAYAEWLSQSPNRSTTSSPNEVITRCLECHNAPKKEHTVSSDAPLAESWKSRFINPKEKKLTRFDHRPHLTLPQLRDCTSCHAMTELPGDAGQLVSLDTSKDSGHDTPSDTLHSTHDFHFLSKKMCVSCHNAETKVQNCTLCHDYHVAPK